MLHQRVQRQNLNELNTTFAILLSYVGGGKQMTLEQMANATRGLPEFQEQTKKMSQHINMAQACSGKIGTMDLLRVGGLEQTMALGTDDVSVGVYSLDAHISTSV